VPKLSRPTLRHQKPELRFASRSKKECSMSGKRLFGFAACLSAAAISSPSGAQVQPKLMGKWVQFSSGQELVLKPRIKLTPYAAPGYGTNLGGSVGYGSATTTVVATESTPLHVERNMALTIAPDGKFTWIVNKRETETASCVRTVKQERHGRVSASGSELVLAVNGGRETSSNNCGGAGERAMPATTLRYRMQLTGNELVLTSGPDRWRFQRR
jgi:hypothetical protein